MISPYYGSWFHKHKASEYLNNRFADIIVQTHQIITGYGHMIVCL